MCLCRFLVPSRPPPFPTSNESSSPSVRRSKENCREPLVIGRLDPAALSVLDLDRSIAFYRDLLGLQLVRILECPPLIRLREVVGMPAFTARIAHLASGDFTLD